MATPVVTPVATPVDLRRTMRAAFLRLFSTAQVLLTWVCLPVSLWLNRKHGNEESAPQLLVISLGGIGDHILTVPVLKALRQKFPDRSITLIVRPQAAGFQQLLPDAIDRELIFPYEDRPLARLLQPIAAMRFVARHALGKRTDLALIPRWEWDSWGAYFLAFFSRARERVTFSEKVNYEKAIHNTFFDTLCTSVYDAPAELHEAAKIRLLLNRHLHIEVDSVAGSLRPRDVHSANGPIHLVIAPLAAHARRNWPLENWATLLARLHEAHDGMRFSLLGSRADLETLSSLASSYPSAEVLGGFPFLAVLERIANADLFIGADSGMAHLAGAVGIPVVQIFCHPQTGIASHYNSPARFAASSPSTVAIQPRPNPGCERACEASHACCIQNVDPLQVFEAVSAQLAHSYAR